MLLPTFFTVLLLAATSRAALPSYIKPCAVSDPQFNACVLQHAKDAVPSLVKGDRKHRVPVLDPLQILELKLEEGNTRGITFKLMNATVTGFKNAVLERVDIDPALKHLKLAFTVPTLTILGIYDVSGRLLILPIVGHGDINSTTVEAKITLSLDMNREQRDGKEYVKLENPDIKMEPKRVYVKLTNLFNGNELLGREMNEFIDKNWKEVNEEISPTVEKAIAQVATSSINNLLSSAPADVVFPQTL